MKEIKIEPIKINDNWFIDTQKQVDETYQKTINYGRTQFVNKIVELEQQLQMFKSLYQNEKDKNDTLNRIIKKTEEYIKSQSPDAGVCGKTILDLLKEIK